MSKQQLRTQVCLCSNVVEPQQYNVMGAFERDVTHGIAARIVEACSQKLSFSSPAAGLLIGAAPESGGLLSGLLEGPGALAKGPASR